VKALPLTLLCLLAGVHMGCHRFQPALPAITDPEIVGAERESLSNSLAACAAEVSTLKVLARVMTWTPAKKGKEKLSYQLSMVFDGQGNLRLDTFAPNSAFALQALVLKSQQVTAVDYSRREALVADRPERLLRRLLGFEASADQLKALFLGCLPPELASGSRLYRGYYITATSPDGRERARFAGDTLKMQEFVSAAILDGRPDYRIAYEWQPELSTPKTLKLTLFRDDSETRLAIMKFATNEAVQAGIFSLRIPESFAQSEF